MNSWLARYIDGDLDESEAIAFLEAVERDPALDAELRAHERLLATASGLDDTTTPPAFVDAVMARVAVASDTVADQAPRSASRVRHPRRPAFARTTGKALAVAAVLTLVFLGGTRFGSSSAPTPGTDDTPVLASTSPGRHTVRLVYVPPEGSDPERVHVAGDFNAWDDARTPLRRVGDVWTTTLVLPPGEYEYQFVENGERWVTDPLALRQRTDGFGGRNAVLDVGV